MKDISVAQYWNKEARKESFFEYFPEKFRKRTPPAEFFWRVYSIIHPQLYKKVVAEQKTRLEKKAPTEIKVVVNSLSKEIYKKVYGKDEDLVTLSNLIRTQTSKPSSGVWTN